MNPGFNQEDGIRTTEITKYGCTTTWVKDEESNDLFDKLPPINKYRTIWTFKMKKFMGEPFVVIDQGANDSRYNRTLFLGAEMQKNEPLDNKFGIDLKKFIPDLFLPILDMPTMAGFPIDIPIFHDEQVGLNEPGFLVFKLKLNLADDEDAHHKLSFYDGLVISFEMTDDKKITKIQAKWVDREQLIAHNRLPLVMRDFVNSINSNE